MKTQSNTSRAAKQPNPSAPQGAKLVAPQDIAGTKPKPGSRAGLAGHSNGNGNGNGNGKASAATAAAGVAARSAETPRARNVRSLRQAAAARAAESDQPHYDEGLRYDSGLRYAVEDPTLPPAGSSKVKLELGPRTDSNLAAFGESHVEAMTGNLLFPDPVPSAAVFAASLAEFEAVLAELDNLRLLTKNKTMVKDQIRKNFEFLFSQRGAYIQTASNSNAEAIASAGLPIRNSPTPVGVLPAPLGLLLEPTMVNGEILARWKSVVGARTYALECAEITPDGPSTWVQVSVSGKLTCLTKQLTPGKRYGFRVAALGGADGSSAWSPVVERMAA